MKKRILSTLFFVVLCCSLLVGCNETKYTITFKSEPIISNGNGSSINALIYNKEFTMFVEKGDVIGDIEIPTPNGYKFLGWFADEDYIEQWYLHKDKVYSDITLYAKWERYN